MLFFFQAEDGIRDLTVTGVQTCALPISLCSHPLSSVFSINVIDPPSGDHLGLSPVGRICWQSLPSESIVKIPSGRDRKSTRLNSSHSQISYAVFCLKKKKKTKKRANAGKIKKYYKTQYVLDDLGLES